MDAAPGSAIDLIRDGIEAPDLSPIAVMRALNSTALSAQVHRHTFNEWYVDVTANESRRGPVPADRDANHRSSDAAGSGGRARGGCVMSTAHDHDAADRQGLKRVTVSRSRSGRCHHCAVVFETMQGAVSHGRSAGHLIEGSYSASYLYAPQDIEVAR